MADFQKLSIKAIRPETAEAAAVEFNIPDALKSSFQFVAGQYLTLRTEINGQDVRRAYSICSAPGSGQLTVLIKKVEKGVFSSFANDQLKVGDTLQVLPPEGRFVLPEATAANANHIFFAAGSGITPVISMLTDLLENQTNARAVLVYGNRSGEQAIFKKDLEALQNQNADRLQIVWIYSRQETDTAHFGRIDRSKVAYIINNKYADTQFDHYYICGPGEMIDKVSEALIDFKVDESAINIERFTVSEPEATATEDNNVPDGQVSITYLIDDESATITAPMDTSVLETAIKHDLDPPYSCQGGICSSCIARVTAGTVVMRKNQILTDSEVAEGLVLTCQAHATSTEITIDYDDV